MSWRCGCAAGVIRQPSPPARGGLPRRRARGGAAHVLAGRDRAFQRQHLVHVADAGVVGLQLGQRQVGQVAAALFAVAYGVGHDFMGVAEGQAALDQVVGQVGGGGEALQRGGAHVVGLDLDAAGHVREDGQRVAQRVHRVEQAFLVFLVVLVVGQGWPFIRVSRATRLPLTRPALPRASSGTSGFFFCGMIELPVQNGRPGR